MSSSSVSTDTSQIRDWKSIVTLVVFIITNIIVLIPFHIPIFVPRALLVAYWRTLAALRIVSPRQCSSQSVLKDGEAQAQGLPIFVQLKFPMNFITAPLIADLFLLAILAIGRTEVYDGTIGADGISPLDIMVFFLTLAYIAISIDASGLIRYLAFKVLQKGGEYGHRLFFYLYVFFFGLGTFVGNDPIILSGTAFLAYLTRVSSNIKHPRAWIHSQFAIANIASAILVSSNPTNLVLAGAFNVKFIVYTANMIVPVVATAIVLFPFLLYIIFPHESLIPQKIEMHKLSDAEKAKAPVNPNIPNARGVAEEEERLATDDRRNLLSLEEIMNPFLDKGGAAFGAVLMAATLVTVVALNASSQTGDEHPVFWVTLPAAFVMFCWDLAFGWKHRHETREIARKGRQEIENLRAQRASQEVLHDESNITREAMHNVACVDEQQPAIDQRTSHGSDSGSKEPGKPTPDATGMTSLSADRTALPDAALDSFDTRGDVERQSKAERSTLVSLTASFYQWSQETFPTVAAVVAHLPFALVPFAFCMFVLVQALVTKGWVPVFAYGWDHWVNKTGTVGAVGGMGFLGVVLCNFAGTNIGTTILLCRVVQAWQQIHHNNGLPISDRTFWATVYGMALGVNYGAFSTAFSASLAGLLWRDILARKHIRVRDLEFARVNLPIIAIAMAVGCTVLIGELYVIRTTLPYDR